MTEEKLEILNSIKDLLEDHPERKEMLLVLEEIITESIIRKEMMIKGSNALSESLDVVAAVKDEMKNIISRNDTLHKKNKELLEENEVLKNLKPDDRFG